MSTIEKRSLHGLIIRTAVMDDMAAIMDMSKYVYYGFDTLHLTFPSLIQRKEYHPYVVDLNGKLVSSLHARIVCICIYRLLNEMGWPLY